ncbi:anthranilate phosphoribosyltransferase [Shewanella yunxiaonensis]|uniref:Anthranilate phosphoribosyltransferase n=1 Tax=Shewanella yunxiaonensis TaxID=2829809 RepID=A0ABX7YWV8_9GAMM|nr:MULTISPECIES: anthranilate phosphoribosyltransferase [Shewanella]MDF0535101.1 anthranilate phosphoribosyltransferase [Shewanella sp. A32]QUN07162.1 anthranilate phosphoribosyltransferase [Shewanella yunxiaonensis]
MPDIQPLMEQLYAGQSLSRSQSKALFAPLIAGELSEAAISALLIALKIKGETIDEISGAADALLAAAKPFPMSGKGVIDIVGTGGDGHNTINISTTACFVAAAAGAKVAKHGNRGVSSKSGASDLLSELGIKLTMSPETAAHCLSDMGICFLFAPHYHGGVRHAVPVRQALKTRTVFNVLGPLINPARPDYMLLGVYSPALVAPIAGVLQALGVKRAMVVHGAGLDEVALHGETLVAELKDDKITEYRLTPADFGVATATIDALEGGTPADNAAITLAVLNGKGTTAQRNAVAINAACALYISGLADNLRAATLLALQTIDSGRAAILVQQLATGSQLETINE